MTAHYLSLRPLQEPFDLGLDESKRAQYLCNFLAFKRPSEKFLQELVAILEAAGVGVEGESIFATSKAVVPEGDGPFLVLRETGGAGPVGNHNDGAGAYRQPSVQLLVHATDSEAAASMAHAAYNAFIAVRNQTIEAA